MFSIIHFIVFITFWSYCKCIYRGPGNVEVDELHNNLEMFVRPMKKLTGLFPNHEIELQFDIEHNPQRRTQRRRINKVTSQPILRKNDVSTPATMSNSESSSLQTPESPEDSNNQVVYMKDLKKAFEDYEKKHNIMNGPEAMQPLLKRDLWMALECNQLSPSNEMSTSTLGNANGLNLADMINVLKKSGQMQKNIPKPNDEELSWLKIQIPA